MVHIDLEKQKMIVSKGTEEVMCFTSAEIEENIDLWFLRTHPEDKEKVDNHYQQLLSGQPSNCVWRIRSKDEKVLWIEVFGNPIVNKSSMG